jgi:hypothetical protein
MKMTFIVDSVLPLRIPIPAVLLIATAVGCAADLAPAAGSAEPRPPTVSTHRVGEALETRIDATWDDVWVYFDFEQGPMGGQTEVTDPAASSVWDLAFQRFKIKSNGGVSGGGGVEVAIVPDMSLEEIDEAPATGWLRDTPDGEDMNPDPDFAFNQGETWFQYDPATHVLQARRQVYVVLTRNGGFVGLQILGYYDDAGTGGYVRFRWKTLKAPGAPRVPAVMTASSAP